MTKQQRQTKDFDTQETADRHLTDIRLRFLGYRIVSRPNGAEAQWERGGKVYRQSEIEEEDES